MTGFIGHGLTELRAHPWRALLSGLSLCFGILAVILIATLGHITADIFVAVEEQQNGRVITARGSIDFGASSSALLRSAATAAKPLTDTGGGAAISVQLHESTGLAHATTQMPPGPPRLQPVTLVAGDMRQIRRLPLLAGRWLDGNGDMPVEIVFNEAGAARWGSTGTPLLLYATANQGPLLATVVGVIADGSSDSNAFVNLAAVVRAQPSVLDNVDAHILIHHPTADLATLSQVASRIAEAAGGTLTDDGIQRIDSIDDVLSQLRTQQLAFSAIAVVALAIAALGILNIGLASIGERTRELVIRRAVGATRGQILLQIIFASFFVGLVAVGVALCVAVVGVEWWAPRQMSPASAFEPPGVPWGAVVAGVLAATGTTILGSMLPAIVASRLDVSMALRD